MGSDETPQGGRGPLEWMLGIEEVLLFVPDVAEARIWYQSLLGTCPVFDHPGYCAFRLGGIALGLHPQDGKNVPGTGQVPYWRVWNLASARAHFEHHGAVMYRGPIIGVDGVSVCQMQDPFGNVWGFVQRVEP